MFIPTLSTPVLTVHIWLIIGYLNLFMSFLDACILTNQSGSAHDLHWEIEQGPLHVSRRPRNS